MIGLAKAMNKQSVPPRTSFSFSINAFAIPLQCSSSASSPSADGASTASSRRSEEGSPSKCRRRRPMRWVRAFFAFVWKHCASSTGPGCYPGPGSFLSHKNNVTRVPYHMRRERRKPKRDIAQARKRVQFLPILAGAWSLHLLVKRPLWSTSVIARRHRFLLLYASRKHNHATLSSCQHLDGADNSRFTMPMCIQEELRKSRTKSC